MYTSTIYIYAVQSSLNIYNTNTSPIDISFPRLRQIKCVFVHRINRCNILNIWPMDYVIVVVRSGLLYVSRNIKCNAIKYLPI